MNIIKNCCWNFFVCIISSAAKLLSWNVCNVCVVMIHCAFWGKTHIQSDDKTVFLCDCRLKTSSTADLQALNSIVFYYIHRYLLFILVYFDAVIDVVIVGRCSCHFSPFTLAFFLFFSLLLHFLTLFPWYISFWQQKHIHINLYKCKYEYRHDLSVQFEWRMKKRHAYTLPALALSLSNWEWRERVYGVHMS